jgi:glycosyltransferase involved in cell wall biosynthesis
VIKLPTPSRSATGQLVGRQEEGYFSLLHADPVVLYAWDSEIRESDAALWAVLDAVKERSAYLILGPSWTVLNGGAREHRAEEMRQLLHRFEHLVAIYICPTASEATALRRGGLPVLHCSEGALVREDLFTPTPRRRPKFDAIYDAKWADYKRHDLAGAIQSLALIAAPPWRPSDGCTVDHYRRAHAAVSHATWISKPWGSDNKRWLSWEEVNAAYNQARVGLCLSRVEGSMAASIQYLLAGLPVVTTANLGGRDEFFDPAYVRWVDDRPEAVAGAVDELVSLDLDPQMIRETTLAKMKQHRDRLQAWIREAILTEGGKLGRWEGDWPAGLANKLREPKVRADKVIAEIKAGGSASTASLPAPPRVHRMSRSDSSGSKTPSAERRAMGHFSLIHPSPVVLFASDSEVLDPTSALWSVLEAVPNRRTYLAIGASWTALGTRAEQLADRVDDVSQRVEQLSVVACCPTAGAAAEVERVGLATLHCSQAALVREDFFRPSPHRKPKIDAIYDAQWADYNRHDLAGAVQSLALIAPGPLMPKQCTIEYFRRADAAVRHATWLSNPWGSKTTRWLSPEETEAAYNKARVGLCLSGVEGVMVASIQYLMAGLSVVTTPNLGGRDEFFDPAYVRWAHDDSRAVAAAVDELVSLDLDPEMIREATLAKVKQHRDRLHAWIREAILTEGDELGEWEGDWPAGLPNKLCEPMARAADVLAEIEQARTEGLIT